MTTEPYVNPLAAREPELARGEYQPFTPEEVEEARLRELKRLERYALAKLLRSLP